MRQPAFARDEHGAAAVEFVILLPVLLTILFAVIDFGRLMWIRNHLVAAMREGARVAAVGAKAQTDPSDGAAGQRVANYLNGTIGGSIAPGSVSVVKNASGLITVKLTNGYAYQPLTPFAPQFGLKNITLRDSATFRWELQN